MEELKLLLGTSPILAAVIILWRTGVLGALASRIKKNGDDKRIQELQEFREEAESNHFHEITELKKDIERLRGDFDNFRVKMENRLTRLETKVFNSYEK